MYKIESFLICRSYALTIPRIVRRGENLTVNIHIFNASDVVETKVAIEHLQGHSMTEMVHTTVNISQGIYRLLIQFHLLPQQLHSPVYCSD